MVFEVRDLWPDVPLAMGILNSRLLAYAARRLETFAYNRASRIVVLAPTMADVLSGKGVTRDKVAVIPNGADLDRFEPGYSSDTNRDLWARPGSDERILLYCGSLGPAHGPEYLVQLATEFFLQSLKIRIVVVGDGKLRANLEAQARDAGCLDRTISFIGQVSHADVPIYYGRADASIMTMADCELLYSHSVQNKFFDSLAAGKPIFANYAGWASKLAEKEGAGVTISRDNVSGAAAALAEHVQDDQWLNTAGREARRLAEQRFSFDLLADNLEQLLQAVVTA
jgi:glycosyltransferase involved in cell wall biosynthesis